MSDVSKQERRGRRKAEKAGLYYVNDFEAGITRRRCGRGFTYVLASGKTVRSKSTRKRIDALVIPPAWTDVWICSKSNGHIQARGRDDAGRRQYIYHPRWRAMSDATKYDRLHLVAEVLPRIRRRVRKDLSLRGLPRERVLAAVVRLIDKAHIRVGNLQYVEERGSRGATTLESEHVEVHGIRVTLDFPGKSGQAREVELSDEKTAKVIRRCEEIDGQFLFCYRDDDGEYRRVDSTDVNEYLREIAGERVSAKDFRTWWGSVIALGALEGSGDAETPNARKKRLVKAVDATAEALGNTRAVCRGSYIHPGIVAAAESGELPSLVEGAASTERSFAEMTKDEVRFASLLAHLDFA